MSPNCETISRICTRVVEAAPDPPTRCRLNGDRLPMESAVDQVRGIRDVAGIRSQGLVGAGHPSISVGRAMPCQCKVVGEGRSLNRRIRSSSPAGARSSGPERRHLVLPPIGRATPTGEASDRTIQDAPDPSESRAPGLTTARHRSDSTANRRAWGACTSAKARRDRNCCDGVVPLQGRTHCLDYPCRV